jgi:hypothetical protein
VRAVAAALPRSLQRGRIGRQFADQFPSEEQAMPRRTRIGWVGPLLVVGLWGQVASAGSDTTAVSSAIVMPGGPRSGANGKNYLNAQGKKTSPDGQYASFGVIDFTVPADLGQVTKVKGLTLTLTQSVPAFAHDGGVKFYLTTDTRTDTNAPAPKATPTLKFDTSTPDGLGNQLTPRYPAGSGKFTKKMTGELDTFSLRVEGEGEMYLRGELNRKGKIRILMVPDSDDVAATYFGAGNSSPSNRPKLAIDAEGGQ